MQVIDGVEYNLSSNMLVRSKKPPMSPLRKVIISVAVLLALFLYPVIMLVIALFLAGWYVIMLSQGVADNIIARVLGGVMLAKHKELKNIKVELFKDLKGHVIDVGSGTGLLFRDFVGKASKVTAIEPNKALRAQLVRAASKFSDSLPVEVVTSTLEQYTGPPPDAIVFGMVLCEVPNVAETVATAARLLNPGGRIYFFEHVAYKRGLARTLQHYFNYYWRMVSGGCSCNRDPVSVFLSRPDLQVHHWSWLSAGSPFPHVRPFACGIAVKK